MKQKPVDITQSTLQHVERILKKGLSVRCVKWQGTKVIARHVNSYFEAVSFFQEK